MSKITIIGTSGAGKTVFITVLAERYSKPIPGKAYMNYLNAETKDYSVAAWSDLVDKQEWPSSTPAGTLPVLEWMLTAPSGESHEMKVVDAPGQDIQAIYRKKTDEDLTEGQLALKKIIDDADVLILLVNISDAANATTERERANFEIPVVMAARGAFARNARVAVLFSQHDQIKALLEARGLDPNDARAAVREFLSGLDAAIESAGSERAYVGFVAAVAETEVVHEADSQGQLIARSRPKKGFKSEGLDEVMKWLAGMLHVVDVEKTNAQIAVAVAKKETKIFESEKALNAEEFNARKFWSVSAVIALGVSIAMYVVGVQIAKWMSDDSRYAVNERKVLDDTPSRVYEKEDPDVFRWDVDKAFCGADDVIIRNLGMKKWKWCKIKLYFPKESKTEERETKDREEIKPGESHKWEEVYNFNKDPNARLSEVQIKYHDDFLKELKNQKESVSVLNQKIEEENAYKRRIYPVITIFIGLCCVALNRMKSFFSIRASIRNLRTQISEGKTAIKQLEKGKKQ